MRDVAIVSFAQSAKAREIRNEIEILMPVVQEAVRNSKLPRQQIGFTCSGSSDYLQGQSFAFVGALDACGQNAFGDHARQVDGPIQPAPLQQPAQAAPKGGFHHGLTTPE